MNMDVRIRKPTVRECERCGRRERWNDTTGTWRLDTDDQDERITGDVFCIHEWDINGTFVPIEVDDVDAEA